MSSQSSNQYAIGYRALKNEVAVSFVLFTIAALTPIGAGRAMIFTIMFMISPLGWGLWLQPVLALLGYIRMRRIRSIDRRIPQLLLLAAVVPLLSVPFAFFVIGFAAELAYPSLPGAPDFLAVTLLQAEFAIGQSLGLLLFAPGGWLLLASSWILLDSAGKSNRLLFSVTQGKEFTPH